ncbi:tryptophan 5-hydroxylase 2-like [Rhagoletis pomonella]|uniref:tryptophan 5-hydroxylase 2-like n=1 Tax=Rhagoletis pomonella TaxID=28610 RepID=UPI00177B7855|nr:tryptophan 5-hydroxylase 2-like [Rhagoletis pomonella]
MSASGKSLLGLWLYRSGEQEWAVKHGSPLHTLRKEHRSLDKSNSESGSEKGSLELSDANSQAMSGDRVSIIFTLKNQVGNLARALQVFQELGINVLHLELSPLEKASNQGASPKKNKIVGFSI